jgi:preprotein translocase subunit SecD
MRFKHHRCKPRRVSAAVPDLERSATSSRSRNINTNTKMKTTTLLLGCLLAFTLSAAEPSKPATFELRLVLDIASPESEELTLTHPGTPQRERIEKLHVQKKPLLDRSALKSAAVQRNATTNAPEIAITFTQRGAKRFAEVTRDHVGKRLAIVIDGKVYSAPKIMTEIPGGKALISGSFTDQEATELAARLNEAGTK